MTELRDDTLLDRSPAELVEFARGQGLPAYRGRQLAEALYRQRVKTVDEITTLPLDLRQRWAEDPGLPVIEVSERFEAQDGSVKYLLSLHDGARIEAVAMPRDDGNFTYCLSSQVGCRMGCVFCATGRMGIIRQLSAGEIVGQVLELQRRHRGTTNPNLVFMGMGEPLDNLDQLLPALRTLTDPEGVGLGARRITVSTSGLTDGIRQLAELDRPIGLAVSLTTGVEEERRRLMPVAARIPMDELLRVAADYGRRFRRKVTLECAVIEGQNDSEDHARRLLELARTGPFKVNLIPLNPIEEYEGDRPAAERLAQMVDVLWQGSVVTTVRDSRGRDVQGACGQLLHRQERREGAPRGRAV